MLNKCQFVLLNGKPSSRHVDRHLATSLEHLDAGVLKVITLDFLDK